MRTVIARPHWSYSSVSQYLKCPLQYYFERVAKLPRKRVTDAQVLGSAVHSALAAYHRKLQSGEPISSEAVRHAYLDSWDGQVGDGRVVASGGKPLGASRDLGMALVDIYLEQPPPRTIVAVECPKMAPIADSRGDYLEKPVMVVADLVTRREDGSLRITEIKTSGRAYSESEAATSLQPTFYANAYYESAGEDPAVEFAVLVKTKVPRLQRIQAVRTTSDYRRLGDLIKVVERAVDAEIFYPVESPLNCSGCPFHRPCREWTGRHGRTHVVASRPEELVAC
ncbi:PD-(D/E)XK nuclease family protein [Paludisphaera sp.]|uniref:RecB family exonuclease n=1 Tax=Paludisphaera sp. TaxID=2017432 RepID=UPI00301C991C